MIRILSGIETEYGLSIEGRSAEDQVEDATAFVRSYPGNCRVGWDYRYESPRADLRGFSVSKLEVDPADARFDAGRQRGHDPDIRSDRILPNGARLYNDHGHPEYSTPECWSLGELALNDLAGQLALLDTASAFEGNTGLRTRVYKNNTDFHGASYGTHENYAVPRSLGFDRLYRAVMPILVARQVLCGAGKVGAETGRACVYQLSQRADFFVEGVNTETLYRRPVFNTRDEPHADPRDWIRLHVISGDANMISSATARKAGLVKLALWLEMIGETPNWRIRDPAGAFQQVSRDESCQFRVELEGGSWTNAREILESYFAAAERVLELRPGHEPRTDRAEAYDLITECRSLLEDLHECPARFARHVDWAAKRRMLEQFMEHESVDWSDPILRSFDLEYHNLDPSEGLFYALQQMNEVDEWPSEQELRPRLERASERTRAWARGLAVARYGNVLDAACWRSLVFNVDGAKAEVTLDPSADFPLQLEEADNVGTFIRCIQDLKS